MRAIWSGALSFGLINIPVSLYSASQDRALHFKLVHKGDHCPIGYEKICKSTGKEIKGTEIVKAYELDNGVTVTLDNEDFKKANAHKTSTIDIESFAEEDEIDPIYYEKPYYIEPNKKAEKAYVLLREALKETKKVGIATFVLREKEKLGVIRVSDNILILNQLRFEDEIKEPSGIKFPEGKKSTGKEMEIAKMLIDKLSEPFKINKFKDTYTEELLEIINQKAKGKKPKQKGSIPTYTEMTDMMAMLKKSLEKKK
jgi:DNA end-binding protein Ku